MLRGWDNCCKKNTVPVNNDNAEAPIMTYHIHSGLVSVDGCNDDDNESWYPCLPPVL